MARRISCDICGLGIDLDPGDEAAVLHEVEVDELRPAGCHPAAGRFKVMVFSSGGVRDGDRDGEMDLCLHCRIRILELGRPTERARAIYDREQQAMDEELGGRAAQLSFGQGDPLGENEAARAVAAEIFSSLGPAAAAGAEPDPLGDEF